MQGKDTKIIGIDNPELTKSIFSLFKNPITNKHPERDVDVKDIFKLISSDQFAHQTEYLRSLKGKESARKYKATAFDYVTFNGRFTSRQDDALIKPSGLFIIDVDHLGDTSDQFKKSIVSDKVIRPLLVFKSPSGDGYKVVIKIDPKIINYQAKSNIMLPIWGAVNRYFEINYSHLIKGDSKNCYIDKSGKDLSRACFICHDPEAFIDIESNVELGEEFLNEFQADNESKFKKIYDRTQKQAVNPATKLSDLAKRHLLPEGNHHPELLTFIGAAKAIGKSVEQTLDYIRTNVDISTESSHSDTDQLEELVRDIYQRYKDPDSGVIYLTPLSIGFGILNLKYSKDAKQYVVSSLFVDEVRNIIHREGFAKRKIGKVYVFIQIEGCMIREVSPENMRDFMTSYIDSIENCISFSYKGQDYNIPAATIRDTYLKNSNNIFNKVWMEHLHIHEVPILKDKEHEIYFYFKNGLVTVSKNGIEFNGSPEHDEYCIWEDQVIKHDYVQITDFTNCHFYKFLRNVTNDDEQRFARMVTGIGYLLHHYFRAREGQAIIFYDEAITDSKTPQGGSGKGLIINAVKQVRNVTKIDGKHFNSKDKFRWEMISPGTQVVWLDDVSPDFEFSVLHSNLTDGWTIERKYLSKFYIDPEDSPKTVICSNSIIKGGGSTNKRRQTPIELSDFYSKQIIRGDEKPIEETHGGLFFDKRTWDSNEWSCFFSVMTNCAFQYGWKRKKARSVKLIQHRVQMRKGLYLS
ncbi:MAG: hypothetical protein IPN13_03290 [Bacteroidetes bacterium]|nr:hypothetical protein [Bacteroidota bacterium]